MSHTNSSVERWDNFSDHGKIAIGQRQSRNIQAVWVPEYKPYALLKNFPGYTVKNKVNGRKITSACIERLNLCAG